MPWRSVWGGRAGPSHAPQPQLSDTLWSGRGGDKDYHDYGRQAAADAIADAGVAFEDIQQAVVGYVYGEGPGRGCPPRHGRAHRPPATHPQATRRAGSASCMSLA